MLIKSVFNHLFFCHLSSDIVQHLIRFNLKLYRTSIMINASISVAFLIIASGIIELEYVQKRFVIMNNVRFTLPVLKNTWRTVHLCVRCKGPYFRQLFETLAADTINARIRSKIVPFLIKQCCSLVFHGNQTLHLYQILQIS